ncbi:PLP-dependent aminotransferase family protein [Castellaniella sp. MT123]|uniref:aminotransferase-like domain-containing protein n=1 Tax=Castellaniella sp. MT123 TaxID=3140381 RepID=UPI0031F3FFFF
MILFEPDRDRKRAPSLVDQAVEALEHAIRDRVLRPGMALPSVRRFAQDHGLSTFTVMAAYNRLVAQGVLQSRPGANFRVARPRQVPASSVPDWVVPRIGSSWLLADVFADHSISIKAGCGWLPPDWHDETGLPHALRQMSRVPVSQMSSYGHPLGYYPLREHIAHHLLEYGLEVEPNQVLLTHGATQALDIVVRTILRPGDHVAVEAPCYANLLQILALNHIVVHAVPRTREGICEQTLEDLASRHPIRAMFVTTVLQNPTGATFTMAGAFRLLQLAERHSILVVEDDVSRDLLSEPAPLLAALAGTSRVIYVSGFAKSVMPSTRVGYLTCAKALLEQCARTKMSLGLTSAEVMERIVHHVLRDGRHATYLRGIRERLHRAHDQVTAAMHEHGFEIWDEPGAGLFLWARPRQPFPGTDGMIGLAARALKAGIWLAPGSYFDPAGHEDGWLRFNVTYSGHPRLWRFFESERTPGPVVEPL